MTNHLLKKQRGYINFLVIFLLLLVSIIVISYMELGQTHLKSSEVFKQTVSNKNTSVSGIELGFYHLNKGFKANGQTFTPMTSIPINETTVALQEYSFSIPSCNLLYSGNSNLDAVRCRAFEIKPQVIGSDDIRKVVFIFDKNSKILARHAIVQ